MFPAAQARQARCFSLLLRLFLSVSAEHQGLVSFAAAGTDEANDPGIVGRSITFQGLHGPKVKRLAIAFEPNLPAPVDKPDCRRIDELNRGFHRRSRRYRLLPDVSL